MSLDVIHCCNKLTAQNSTHFISFRNSSQYRIYQKIVSLYSNILKSLQIYLFHVTAVSKVGKFSKFSFQALSVIIFILFWVDLLKNAKNAKKKKKKVK